MPLDAICLSALTAELREKLEGAKIDKVQQPERDMLILSLRGRSGNFRLLMVAGAGNARVHLTGESMENPAEPPMFCMLLRKHLVGARIAALEQPDHERMLVFDLDTRDEMGDLFRKKLAVEMIGRSANVILVGPDGRIIDCMRRMDFAGDAERRLLPGMIYSLPPKQNKRDFISSDSETRRALIAGADREIPVDKWLLDNFSGLSPLICRELAFRCGGSFATLPEQLDALHDTVTNGDFTPYMLLDGDKPRDFSFMPIRQYGGSMKGEGFDSFSALLDAFYARRDRAER